MSNYVARLRSDDGICMLSVFAMNRGAAIVMICKSEGCPPRAIISVNKVEK